MTTTTFTASLAALHTAPHTGAVTSQDGTAIGYRQFGAGPGLVLVHGAMESALSHQQLAEAMADRFTVTTYDRRGRGRSGPFGPAYTVRQEVEDLDALLTRTGAGLVFGVSAGGIIALEAALALPAIRQVAVYEPSLMLNGSPSTAFLARYDQEITAGRLAAALVTGMQGAQMGPAILKLLPRWLLEALTSRMLAAEDKAAAPDDVTIRALAPTLHYDFQLVRASDGALPRYHAIQAQVLLLGGSASPAYLQTALTALAQTLPQARHIVFPGLGHGASGNTDRGGQPARVAQALREFFVD